MTPDRAPAVSVRHTNLHLVRRIAFELRLACSWTWMLPLVGLALVFLALARGDTPFAARPAALRASLELALGPTALPLSVPLFASEWERRTVAQVALGDRLVRVLAWRFGLVLVYLVGLVTMATALSLYRAGPTAPSGVLVWMRDSLLVVLPPMLLLTALALLAAHLTVSAATGYVVAIGYWLGNLLASIALPPTTPIAPYLLFSWSMETGPQASGWIAGKLTLVGVAALLFSIQAPLLRREARYLRNHGEE